MLIESIYIYRYIVFSKQINLTKRFRHKALNIIEHKVNQFRLRMNDTIATSSHNTRRMTADFANQSLAKLDARHSSS